MVLATIQRVMRAEERAQAVEAKLLRRAEAGSKHPDLARSLVESRQVAQDCESLVGRLASAAVRCEQQAGSGLVN